MPAENQQPESARSIATAGRAWRFRLIIHMSCALGLIVVGTMGLVRSGGHHNSDLWLSPYLSDIAWCLPFGFVWGALALDRAVRRVKSGKRRLVAIVGAAMLLMGLMAAPIAGVVLLNGQP